SSASAARSPKPASRPSCPSRADALVATRDLASATIRFGALLRAHGLPVTLVQITTAVRTLEHVDIGDREELQPAVLAVVVTRPEEVVTFDRCFEAFWQATLAPEQGIPGLLAPPVPDLAPPATLRNTSQKRETLDLDAWGDEPDADSGEPLGVPGLS